MLILLISAYVISVPVYKQKDFEKVQQTLFKRYPRLELPVFFSSVISYILYTRGYFNQEVEDALGNQWLMGKYTEPLTLKNLFLTSLIKVWWNRDASFNAPFWMLQILFLGINIILLISAFCLPGYSSIVIKVITYTFRENTFVCNGSFYNIVGSFLLIFSLMGMEKVKECFEKSKILNGVSEISFSVYLVHWPIVCSLSCFLYLKLQEMNIGKNIVCTVVFVITVIVVAIVAKIFNKFVEKKICDRAVAKICERYFEKSI